MHCFERMLRRASLPLCTTQGFHPQPRMIFAQSLALGIAGSAEVIELELSEVLSAEEVHDRLVRQAPPGLEILHTLAIDFKAKAQVRRAFYRLQVEATGNREQGTGSRERSTEFVPCSLFPIPCSLFPIPCSLFPVSCCDDLAQRCTQLLAQSEIWIERVRPRPRRFNLRPYVSKLTYSPPSLEMALWVTPNGAVRPEEMAQLLGLAPLLEEGAFFERTSLELYDEVAKDDPEIIPPCLKKGYA